MTVSDGSMRGRLLPIEPRDDERREVGRQPVAVERVAVAKVSLGSLPHRRPDSSGLGTDAAETADSVDRSLDLVDLLGVLECTRDGDCKLGGRLDGSDGLDDVEHGRVQDRVRPVARKRPARRARAP